MNGWQILFPIIYYACIVLTTVIPKVTYTLTLIQDL